MTDIRSFLVRSADELRERIRQQSADNKLQQEAFLELFCNHYDTLLEELGRQIDSNAEHIEALQDVVDDIGDRVVQPGGYRSRTEYRPLEKAEKEAIATLHRASTVTAVGLTVLERPPDEFDKLDELALRGELDDGGRPETPAGY